jgi:Ca2+-binding EF-hand superfamily protein
MSAARTRRRDVDLMMDERTFQQLDVNQRGALSYDEFHPWCKRQGISDREAQEIFEIVDRDGDGLVSYKELVSAFEESKAAFEEPL